MSEATMAWIDMETTGLEAAQDVPLELGIMLTDNHLKVIAWDSWLIREDSIRWDAALARGHANKFVQPMHEASGLWDDLETERTHTRVEVDELASKFLQDNGVKYGTLPMCGNSVGSLDRPFTLVHLPKFNEALSYRNIDISTFKEVCRRVNPELFERLRDVADTKGSATHRVMDDIDGSIAEYHAYLENFIFTGDDF